MNEDVIRKLVLEALDLSLTARATEIEVKLLEIINYELSSKDIAQAIWDMHKAEFMEAAAEIASKRLLPF